MVHVILVAKICLSVFPIFCLFFVIFFSPDLGGNERSLCQWNLSWRECVCVAGQKSPALRLSSKVISGNNPTTSISFCVICVANMATLMESMQMKM